MNPKAQRISERIHKQDLMELARKEPSAEDFIMRVQQRAGIRDRNLNLLPMFNPLRSTHVIGEAEILAIDRLYPGEGWFYAAQKIWREAHG